MSLHSAILGGSNSARLLACPASYSEQMKIPVVDVESSYAAEGTAMHQAAAHCVENGVSPETLGNELFYSHVMTPERVETMRRGFDALNELMDRYGGKFKVVGIEEMLSLPGVTGAFGSVDLILANTTTAIIADWKYGSGVKVSALYADAEGYEYLNPQLAFYAAAARDKFRRRFRGKKIVAAIIQPRLEEPLSVAETDDAELDAFLSAFQAAFVEALGRNPHRERGEHCKFAACKATCELWTSSVIDMSMIDPSLKSLQASVGKAEDYGTFLGTALDIAEIAETWIAEIRRQAHVYLEGEGKVPNWKLVPKRGTRQWVNPVTAGTDMLAVGAAPEDVWTEPELRSVAQAEKALKKKGIELPADLFHTVVSGTTIAPADDARPTVAHVEVRDQLRQALKAL